MKDNALKNIERLRNIGPKSARQLVAVGITSHTQLKKLGAEKAFMKLWEKFGGEMEINALYLYALEGAIYDIDFRAIPEKRKKEFRELTKELRNS